MELAGIGVILTGATGGIGSALAVELTAAGADVLAIGRRRDALTELGRACPTPGRLHALVADITLADDRARIVAAARALPRPALLVHAAACGRFGLFADGSDAEAGRLFATNVLAPMALTRSLLPLLSRQPEAAVVAVGSTFGSIGFPGFAEYSASKFALRGLFEALAREHADDTVRFQWLSPRATETAFNTTQVQAFNRATGTAVDPPAIVAHELLQAIRAGRLRKQLGWPEKLFVRINGALPSLVDRALRKTLPLVRLHAAPSPPCPSTQEPSHETP